MKKLLTLLLCLAVSFPALANKGVAPAFPAVLSKALGKQPGQVGTAQYRKLGFFIYRVTLWSKNGTYDRSKPYALSLNYLRSLSKKTVVDAVVSDVKAQKKADDATMAKWEAKLNKVLPAVKSGDDITGVYVPGKPSKLYHNGKEIASISEKRLSEAFFNIWLGDVADPNIRAQLIASNVTN